LTLVSTSTAPASPPRPPNNLRASKAIKAIKAATHPTAPKSQNYYFDNAHVERLLTRYVQNGCVGVELRNEIMGHAMELIRQIIRTHNLHIIYPGRNPAAFQDLVHVAWQQIESVLYKFVPGKAKVFNMWSQISRTVILAHIKKETRDKKNSGPYTGHLTERHKNTKTVISRFVAEASEMFKYNPEYARIIKAIDALAKQDERPHDGLIGKLAQRSGLPKARVSAFIRLVRLHSLNFTDSGVGDRSRHLYIRHLKAGCDNMDDED
jgi:hypothetical protein